MIAAIALAATVAACSWDRPGVDPFMGDVPAAVDRYTDIPREIRAALKLRMQRRTYDTVAVITRDEIIAPGGERFGLLRDMHFGNGRVCSEVTRARWTNDMQERGLVYCEQGHCLIVPTVCRNVSQISRLVPPPPRLDDIPGGSALATGWTFEADPGSEGSWLSRADIEPIRLPVSDPPAPVARAFAEPIPEPSTFAGFALSLGVLGLFLMHRRRRTVYDVVLVMMPKRRNVV